MKTRKNFVTVDLTADSGDDSKSHLRGSKRPAESTLKVSPTKKAAVNNNLHDRMKNNLSKLMGKTHHDNNPSFICDDQNLINFRQELMSEIQLTNPDILFVKLEGNVPYNETMTFQKNVNNTNPDMTQNNTPVLRSSQRQTKNTKNIKPNIIENNNKVSNKKPGLIKVSDLRANIAKKCANNNNNTIQNTSQMNIMNNMRQNVRLRFRNEISKANKYQVKSTPSTSSSTPSFAVSNMRQKIMAKCTSTPNKSTFNMNKKQFNNSSIFVNIRQSIIEKCRLGAEKTNDTDQNSNVPKKNTKVAQNNKTPNVKSVASTSNKKKNQVVAKGNGKKKIIKTESTDRVSRSSVKRSKRTPVKKSPDGKSSR